jgi:hypothetical protein
VAFRRPSNSHRQKTFALTRDAGTNVTQQAMQLTHRAPQQARITGDG